MSNLKMALDILPKLTPEELADLLLAAQAQQHEKAQITKFKLGTLAKIKWSDGKVYHGVMVGGGQKAKVWLPHQDRFQYCSLPWTSVIMLDHSRIFKIDSVMKTISEDGMKEFREEFGKEMPSTIKRTKK